MSKIALLIFFFASGCQAQMQAWQRDRTISRLSKVESYHGHYTETGIGEKPLATEIWFQAPASYTVVAGDGSFLVSEPGSLKMYDPSSHIAVTYKNLPVLTALAAREGLGDQFDQNVNLFTYTLGSYSKVAGLETIELRFKGNGLVTKGLSQIYDPYSFPLATNLEFANASYSLTFSSIEFNKGTKPPVKTIPSDALVSDWDYNSKSIALPDAQKELAFKLPKTDLPLVKIIRQKGPIPAFTAYYAKGPHLLSVLVYKNYGMKTAERGVKVAGGRLRPGPHLSTFSIARGDLNYVYTFTGPLTTF